MHAPISQPLEKQEKEYRIWLTIVRSWAVLLVVIFHSSFSYEEGITGEIARKINEIMSFRMPLFFFISGYLLYHTKISTNKSYISVLKDNVTRILYPYISITLILLIGKAIFSNYVDRPVDFSLTTIFNSFLYPRQGPWITLWFLNTILIYFLCYPLYNFILKYKITEKLFLCLLIVSNIFIPKDITVLDISSIGLFFIYFYSGILFSKYHCEHYLRSIFQGIPLMILFIITNSIEVPGILHAASGILLSIWLAIRLAGILPGAFKHFRNYYYQIYLLGTFFQAFLLLIYSKISSHNFYTGILFGTLTIIAGIYGPIYFTKLIKAFRLWPLYRVIGLK